MKMLKSKKALSPVVAAIILIAVTVAVSLAVAIWMGSLTSGQMQTENLHIIQVAFPEEGTIRIYLRNTGSFSIIVKEIWVTGGTQGPENLLEGDTDGETVGANTDKVLDYSFTWTAGSSYQVRVVTAKGNQFYYTAVAPAP